MPGGDDNVVRVRRDCVCDRWRVYDPEDRANFRASRGRTPREGFDKDKMNILRWPQDKPFPRLRGC